MKTQEATTTTTTISTKKPAKKSKATKATAKPALKEAAAKGTKATKSSDKPKVAKKSRAGSKTAIVLELLRRKDGASIAEIAEATNWLNHSIRGFLSGQVSNKMGLKLESEKVDGERRYWVPA